jgi:hypothetical protein
MLYVPEYRFALGVRIVEELAKAIYTDDPACSSTGLYLIVFDVAVMWKHMPSIAM